MPMRTIARRMQLIDYLSLFVLAVSTGWLVVLAIRA
jgi:hypothetical protein